MSLLIGGDVCPVFRHASALAESDVGGVLSGIKSVLSSADLGIVNLECPLTSVESPIAKAGPSFRAPEACATGLAGMGVRVVNLANNHIMDHGAVGLANTTKALAAAGIEGFGAGATLAEASRVLVRNVAGLRIGLLGLAGKEFSVAGPGKPGACPLDAIVAERAIRNSRDQWDVLIVFVHAGSHLAAYPSPALQALGRWLVEIGAGAVVFQHSHRVGCVEAVDDGLIVYGQGNLLFDWIPDPGPLWNDGVLLELRLGASGLRGWRAIPTRRVPESGVVQVLDADEGTAILEGLLARSAEVHDDATVARQWRAFCRENAEDYAGMLSGRRWYARLRRRLRTYLGVQWRPWSRERRLLLANLIRCEDHREALETILADDE